MFKKITCSVCGLEFSALVAKRYTVTTNSTRSGLISAFGSVIPETLYDAFDCPACGCQMRLNKRLLPFLPVDNESVEEVESDG